MLEWLTNQNWKLTMKSFVLALVAAAVLSSAAAALMISSQKLAYQAYTTSGARVSDPGHNLVGPNWTGEGAAKRS